MNLNHKFDRQKFSEYYKNKAHSTLYIANKLQEYVENHDNVTLSVFIGCESNELKREYVRNLAKSGRNINLDTAKLIGKIICDDENKFISTTEELAAVNDKEINSILEYMNNHSKPTDNLIDIITYFYMYLVNLSSLFGLTQGFLYFNKENYSFEYTVREYNNLLNKLEKVIDKDIDKELKNIFFSVIDEYKFMITTDDYPPISTNSILVKHNKKLGYYSPEYDIDNKLYKAYEHLFKISSIEETDVVIRHGYLASLSNDEYLNISIELKEALFNIYDEIISSLYKENL